MLEKIDLSKKMNKKEYRRKMAELEPQLAYLQRECKRLKMPVAIVFEGFGAAGKGMQIGKLIYALDPRGFEVFTVKKETEEESMHPFLWRFWTKTPEKGRIAIFDGSWYRRVLIDRFDKKTKAKELANAYDEICSFERQLVSGGTQIIKLFLYIDQKEQHKRFQKLSEAEETAWRVSKGDLKRNRKYDKYRNINEEMLQKTDTDYAPWDIIEAVDKRYATVRIYTIVIKYLTAAIKETEQKAVVKRYEPLEVKGESFGDSILSKANLKLSYTNYGYRTKLKKLQKKMQSLHGELYLRRIPVVIGFEGWDASGKGGAIKRLTEKMDPRGYVVNAIAAPNDIEQNHHYLWRFWRTMPKNGHVAIYDRTWYGRVMVERVEGFCSVKEWQRAYKEINEMESHLVNSGAIVIKFWMQIDKDEQERRFAERLNNPEKSWKITDEDWRNREKWTQYEDAVNEMLVRTSTPKSPWIVVEGNSKYYARIKVLESVVKAIEHHLKHM